MIVRRQRLVARFESLKIDALLVSHLPNIRYLTGFTGSNALLLVTPKESVFFTDPRYTIQAGEETGFEPRIVRGKSAWLALPQAIKRRKLARVGFETHHATHGEFSVIAGSAALEPVAHVVESLRMVKDANEIALIRRSCELNSLAYEAALKRFQRGMTELDLAAELNYQHRRVGAEGESFDTIVASGKRSALPHAHPTGAAIEENELLLIDMGALYRGYASDMTRVVSVGKPKPKVKHLYQAILESQLAAIGSVRAGIPAAKVDQAARNNLKEKNLDKLFVHSTGHGLGLEIHESPGLRKTDKTVLETGMAITIEPGVYLQGLGGIRIEDTVLVTDRGCEVLTPTPKQFLEL